MNIKLKIWRQKNAKSKGRFETYQLNDVAEELNGKAKVAKVDVDQHQSLAAKYNVRSIPTLILLRDGKEVKRFVGVKDKNFLLKQIKEVM